MNIKDKSDNLLATVIRYSEITEGKNFITDNDSEFQVASFDLEEGTVIEKHYHPEQIRKVSKTTEVLVILEGQMEVQIYDNKLDFKQQIGAFKNLPDFFLLIWNCNSWLTILNVLLRVAKASLPLSMLYVGKLIIDEIVRISEIFEGSSITLVW